MRKMFIIGLSFYLAIGTTTAQLKKVNTGVDVSLRSLSIANEQTILASGQKNTVLYTSDGGITWTKQIVGDERLNLDFRSSAILPNGVVLIANAGSPAYIFRADSLGGAFKVVYTNTDSLAFIDAIDFWDSMRGAALLDPTNEKWNILLTRDGGNSWSLLDTAIAPAATNGDAAFAASGTAFRAFKKGFGAFVSGGGTSARVYLSEDYGNTWTQRYTFLPANQSSGLFSLTQNTRNDLICVGGNYTQPFDSSANAVYLEKREFNKITIPATQMPSGYRCAVETVGNKTLIAVGDKGMDISIDHGFTWNTFGEEGYYAVKCINKRCWFSGKNGKIAYYTIE